MSSEDMKSFKVKRPKTLKEYIKLFNRSENEEWIEFCKSNPDFFYKIQLEMRLSSLKDAMHAIKISEDSLKISPLKETGQLLLVQSILLGNHLIKRAKIALAYLEEIKYLSKEQVENFTKDLDQFQQKILAYTRKYANVIRL